MPEICASRATTIARANTISVHWQRRIKPYGLATVGGLDLATFLLGDVTSLARYVTNPTLTNINNAAERQKRLFFYGQDTYRATSKLTLNYGLRWEIYYS